MVNMSKINYFKYLIKKYWKLEAVIAAVMLVFITLSKVLMLDTDGYTYGSLWSDSTAVLELYVTTTYISCAISCFTPVYLNAYLYRKNSCDLYLSLPMKREKMFNTHFIYGCLSVIVPMIPCYLITIVYYMLNGINVSIYALYILIVLIVVNVILQAVTTLFSVKSNRLLDAIVAVFGFLIVPLICVSCINGAFDVLTSYFIVGHMNGAHDFLVIKHLEGLISLPQTALSFFGTTDFGMYMNEYRIFYLVWWMLIGVLAYFYAHKSYVQRASEDSEQYTSSKLIYPLMIHAGLISILFYVSAFAQGYVSKAFWLILMFVGYFIALAFAERKIQWKKTTVLIFIASYVVINLFSRSYVQTNGYGLLYELPQVEQISTINAEYYLWDDDIYGNNQIKAEQEDFENCYQTIEEMVQHCLNERIGPNGEMYIKWGDYAVYGAVELRFVLKDGKEINRYYELDVMDSYQAAKKLHDKDFEPSK